MGRRLPSVKSSSGGLRRCDRPELTLAPGLSIKPMQRGNTVILLEILRFGGDLCRVELDLFWILFGFDFNKPLDWVFHRLGQVV
jgi:hypothetical protein